MFGWWAFSSTSVQKTAARAFISAGESTMFIIDAVGVDISAFSRFPDEQEVLLLPGTGFVVNQSVQIEPKYWTYELSVYQALKQPSEHHQPPAKEKSENRDQQHPSSVDVVRNHDDGLISQFQLVDLPHPDIASFFQQ